MISTLPPNKLDGINSRRHMFFYLPKQVVQAQLKRTSQMVVLASRRRLLMEPICHGRPGRINRGQDQARRPAGLSELRWNVDWTGGGKFLRQDCLFFESSYLLDCLISCLWVASFIYQEILYDSRFFPYSLLRCAKIVVLQSKLSIFIGMKLVWLSVCQKPTLSHYFIKQMVFLRLT